MATVIDVESLASFIGVDSQRSLSRDHCICRIPGILARHNKEAYSPNCFSFGPLNHHEPNLKETEKIKQQYFLGLLSRSVKMPGAKKQEAMMREWLDSVKAVEGKARDCYSGTLDQEVDQNFIEILVVDGCFIIELFRKYGGVVPKEKDDPIFSMSCMLQYLRHDLILLENQIPWFVLQILFNKTKDPSETKSLIELALAFFGNIFTSRPPTFKPKLFVDGNVKHILDLLRSSLVLPSEEVKKYRSMPSQHRLVWQPIPSVTRLKEAGVKFVKVSADSILDVKFRNGVLEIPSLLIQETTETIFRNLISYEQCLPNCDPIFTSYAKVMDNLIDSTGDMELLCKKEVFDNWLSPEDATEFFNKLYNDTFLKEFYYGELSDKLNNHCRQWWPRWRASYVQNYFTKPWAVVAQIYAIIMLALTFWQAYKSG
ncbi:hypothetical protein PTKIN_Ptkin08bG0014400 [Pterospermum kingtungense]